MTALDEQDIDVLLRALDQAVRAWTGHSAYLRRIAAASETPHDFPSINPLHAGLLTKHYDQLADAALTLRQRIKSSGGVHLDDG